MAHSSFDSLVISRQEEMLSIRNKIDALSGIGMIDAIHTTFNKESILCTVEMVSQGMNGIVSTREVY